HGALISVSKLLEMAADAHIVPVICNDTGGVLAYGHTQRLASPEQRRALAARDGGCCLPRGGRPAPWTGAHPLPEWIQLGPTDIDNMCLLCRYHHRNFGRLGWEIVMTDGVPHWRPPYWLDRDQKPIRNHAHHPPDLTFPNVA